MSKLLKLESARGHERLLYNDLLLNDDLKWGATFNFKKDYALILIIMMRDYLIYLKPYITP